MDTGRSAGRDAEETARLAQRLADAAAGCPGVARLSPGPAGTYLPDAVVPGVVVDGPTVRLYVVARYGEPLAGVADQVRAAVRPLAPAQRIDVVIDDLDVEGG